MSPRRGFLALLVVLVVLNVILFGLSFWQRLSLEEQNRFRAQDRERARIELNRLQDLLGAAERDVEKGAAELARVTTDLASMRDFASTERSHGQEMTPVATEQSDVPPVDPFEDRSRRPDIRAIPILGQEEMAGLYRRRDALPRGISDGVLLNGDLDMVLDDPQWNPSARVPTMEERAAIEGKMRNYRFFKLISPIQRLQEAILPEVELLREGGMYIELPVESPPPLTPGVRITHAEPSDRAGFYRLYSFYEEDHPELYHDETVEQQRSIEALVDIFDLINSHQPPENPHDQ